MTYQQTIDFLFSSLPMFQRIGDAAIKKDLTNIRKLCSRLGDPHHTFKSIHIAGTNGKGSTSHMLASVFQAGGYKTGLYTSPHYVDFRERIRINGDMISEEEVIRFVQDHKQSWEEIQPSFFEISVAMAFDHFRNHKVDMAIIETGLGGRLDSTNIITPMMSVITDISYDHMQMLGNTLSEIAFEKAGIIKPHVPVIIGQRHEETEKVFLQRAHETAAPIFFAPGHIMIETLESGVYHVLIEDHVWLDELRTDMTGPYQYKNLRTVAEAIFRWNESYPSHHISDEVIRKGLQNVIHATNMTGRWMMIRQSPLVITDAAHNLDGIRQIIPAIAEISAERKHFVLGFVSDKDVSKILALFPKDGIYYWCSPDIPRGKPAEQTMEAGASIGLYGKAYHSVKDAYLSALNSANSTDFIFVGGSSYVVGDFLAVQK